MTQRAESLPTTVLITMLVAIGSFSTSIYAPSMPTLTAEFDTTTDQVKLTLSVFLVGFAFGQLAYGPISDRFGRRGILLVGLAIFTFGSILCAMSQSIEAMIAGRFVQAIGACSGPALGRAVVRDIHGRQNSARVFAWIGAAMAVSPAIGPILGGHLHAWFGWQANFVVLAVLGLALLLAVALFLGETNRFLDPDAIDIPGMARNFGTLLADRRYLGYLLCGSLVFAGLYSYIAVGPFLVIERLGYSPKEFGFLTIYTTSCYVAGSLCAARFTARIGLDRAIFIGCLLATLGGAAMLGFACYVLSVPTLVGPMMVFSFGMGLTLPNCLAGGLIPFPRMAGAASALLGFTQTAAAALATVLVAVLPQYSAVSAGGSLGGLGALALLSWIVFLRRAPSLAPAASD